MVTGIQQTSLQVSVEPARSRQTPASGFSEAMRNGTVAVSSGLSNGANILSSFVPGAGVVSAVANVVSQVAGGDGLGANRSSLIQAEERLQQEGFANSMHLLQLQKQMQADTEAFQTVSNVMKSRHEMAKAAIGNLR